MPLIRPPPSTHLPDRHGVTASPGPLGAPHRAGHAPQRALPRVGDRRQLLGRGLGGRARTTGELKGQFKGLRPIPICLQLSVGVKLKGIYSTLGRSLRPIPLIPILQQSLGFLAEVHHFTLEDPSTLQPLPLFFGTARVECGPLGCARSARSD